MSYRVAGQITIPGKVEELQLEKVRSAKGFGRWIYCKYCKKNVKPVLSGMNQIACSKCGAGLSPDFPTTDELKHWLARSKP